MSGNLALSKLACDSARRGSKYGHGISHSSIERRRFGVTE
jgi:hypothetical protein